MVDAISQFFSSIFGDNVVLATIIIAIIPIIELKGAIPFGTSTQCWGANALSPLSAYGYALIGSSLVVPILALIFLPIYKAIKDKKFFRKIVHFFVGGVEDKKDKIEAQNAGKTSTKKLLAKMLSVFVFVAFPVPLTGVWTGTCLAVLLGLDFWQTCTSVILGNAVCGLIVATICVIFPNATTIILFVFLAVVLVAIIAKIIAHFVHSKKQLSA
jgi:uncharacterized membrane protein